jgi:peptide/nickel transport system substrate-binding protein
MDRQLLSRRRFLGMALVGSTASLLAACGPSAPAPAKPAESKPAESKPAEAAKPAESKPAEAAKPAESKPAEAAKPATKDSQVSGTLVIAKSDEPNSIDPHVHDGWYSVRAHSAVYETMVDMTWDAQKKEVELKPLLAESWDISSDRLKYTFKLRKGVKFHDSTPFTSESVKATFERNKALGMRASWQVAPINTIETPDESTVVVTLKEPYTPFLQAMARAYIMNHKLLQENNKGDNAQPFFNQNMNGTGPYKFLRWDRDSIIEFEANKDYWGGWAGKHFEKIVLRHVPDRATQRLLIEKGEVDFALQLAPDDINALKSVSGLNVMIEPTTSVFGFPMKLRNALKDVKVRQALAWSFPYDDAIKGIRGGLGERAYGPFATGVVGNTEEGITKYQFDLNRAKQILDEAGYRPGASGIREKDGQPLAFEVWTIAALAFEKEAALLWQSKLKEIGVDLKPVEQSAIASYVTATYNYDAPADMYGWVVSMFIPDPSDIARHYHTRNFNGLNTPFYTNEKVDALIDQGAQAAPGPDRAKVYEQIHRQINEDSPYIWVWLEQKAIVHRTNLQGFTYNPVDYIREFRYHDLYRE